jgi:acyl dehydratase
VCRWWSIATPSSRLQKQWGPDMSFIPGGVTSNIEVAEQLWVDTAREGLASVVYTEGPVSRTDIVRYAGAGGDFNPIHHDEVFAKEAGLPSVFAMGLLGAGYLARLVSDWLGLQNLRSFRVRFAAQVWPGEVLHSSGTVVRVHKDDGELRVEAAFQMTNAEGEIKISGSAIARLESR